MKESRLAGFSIFEKQSGRCEYSTLEMRAKGLRCPSPAKRKIKTVDGMTHLVCIYHMEKERRYGNLVDSEAL